MCENNWFYQNIELIQFRMQLVITSDIKSEGHQVDLLVEVFSISYSNQVSFLNERIYVLNISYIKFYFLISTKE